jgi:hypothetical protein
VLPLEARYGTTILALDASERVLVAINRSSTVIFNETRGGRGLAAATVESLLPILPGSLPNGVTIYRYRTGAAGGELFYESPPQGSADGAGVPLAYSGQSVTGMNATAEGGVILSGTLPPNYAGQPDGLLKLRADGTVDTGFTPAGLAGLRVATLQAAADGWLVTGQSTGALGPGQQVLKFDPAFGARGNFSANLRQIGQVESALTLPDGSVLVRGAFSGPADEVQRYVRVTADGAVDFAQVPHGTGVATLGADGKIYLGGWARGAFIFDLRGVIETALAGVVVGVPAAGGDNEVERYSATGVRDEAFGWRSLAAAHLTSVWVDDAGRVVLGGYDQPVTGGTVAKVARLLPTGETDATFVAQSLPTGDGLVRSVAGLPGGAGYAFLIGTQQTRIVALDPNGRQLATGSGVGVNYAIDGAAALVPAGGMVFAAGDFNAVLGVASPGIVRLGADGLPDPRWRSGLAEGSWVNDVLALADGRILVSGVARFPGGGGTSAVLNADGSVDLNEVLPNATALAQMGDGSLLAFLVNGTTQRWRAVARADVTVTGAESGRVFSPGERVTLTVALPPGAGAIVWLHDGVAVPGATSAVLEIAAATAADAGVYAVRWESGGATAVQSVRVTVRAAGARIANVSARSLVGAGEAVQITGFVTTGTSDRPVLLRSARGALAQFGVAHAAASADWELFVNGQRTYGVWFMGYPIYRGMEAIENTVLRAGAFGFADTAANLQGQLTLLPGQSYSVIAAATPAQAGVALSELYVPLDGDTSPGGVRLRNFSCRAVSGPGEGILIAGFVVVGDRPLRVLICGRGPGLARYGVAGAIADPAITLWRGAELIAANDDWEAQPGAGAIAAAVVRTGAGEFRAGERDAALLVELAPGAYSVLLDPKSTPMRVGMVEIFDAGE